MRRTVLDHLLTAAERTGRGQITNAEAITHLAGIDPARFGRQDHESESVWLSRTGKTLRTELAGLGTDLAQGRLTEPNGSRPNGYTLQALQDAAAALGNAA